jgi:HemK-like putative methylase
MEVTFYGLSFVSEPGVVFTPRPATERLVAAALEQMGDQPLRVADVGTGAGVVAIALAVYAPAAGVWATDTSPPAIRLARLNAERLGVADRVHVRRGNLLEPIEPPLDLIAANLPYLPDALRGLEEYASEPETAVYAPARGIAHYDRLLECAEERLTPEGLILIQFHREILTSDRDGLAGLRARLEWIQSAQWVAS